jgi:hypothetical protein
LLSTARRMAGLVQVVPITRNAASMPAAPH